jgi:hypothetical protein
MEFYDIGTKEPYVINGEAVRQRKRLAELINQRAAMSDFKTAYRAVIEEVAYTWFNRLMPSGLWKSMIIAFPHSCAVLRDQ